MSLEGNLIRVTKKITEDLSSDTLTGTAATTGFQRFVVAGGTTAVPTMVRCGAGALAYGILDSKPEADQAAPVKVQGISKVMLGGTVTPGTEVMSDASGRAVAATSGLFVCGIVEDGGAIDEIGSVLLVGPYHKA